MNRIRALTLYVINKIEQTVSKKSIFPFYWLIKGIILRQENKS